jgi:hypothetical protein
MPTVKEQQQQWVQAVMAYLGVKSYNALAVQAGIDPSLIQKPFNPNYKGKFGADTLSAIAKAANLRVMEYPNRPLGLAEAEAEPFQYEERSDAIEANVDRAVRELVKGRNGRDPWVIRGYALELSGILPGDVVIVDLNMQPRPKDVVCAQIYDWSSMKAETVFRVYDPPYLMTNSLRFGVQKPLLVDDRSVVIRGVVDVTLRRRQLAA